MDEHYAEKVNFDGDTVTVTCICGHETDARPTEAEARQAQTIHEKETS